MGIETKKIPYTFDRLMMHAHMHADFQCLEQFNITTAPHTSTETHSTYILLSQEPGWQLVLVL